MTIWRVAAIGLGLAALAVAGLYTFAVAQDQEELEERNALVEFVERIISTPDRQIRLGTISGALSSNVSFSEITIADRAGVWLRIDNVHLVWSRTALILGRLEISQLEADSIVMERRPLPPEEAIPEEARLTIPEVPVATNIERLAVPRVSFGEDVFGLSSELSVTGRLRLAEGDLDTALEIERLDGPGGLLSLAAVFDSGAETLDLDVRLSEPEDGVVANLLDLRGRPALTFAVVGAGPLADFSADISLVADDQELLQGSTEIVRVADGFRFVADVAGRLGELVPAAYADLFGEASTLSIDAIRADDGSVSIARADVVSGVMALNASAELAPDWFPVAFALDARLGADTDDLVTLPFGEGVLVRRAHILADVGGEDGESWSAAFDLEGLVTGTLTAERATVTAGGIARNRDDPEAREVTFEIAGAATGLASPDPAIADALGGALELAAAGGWSYGEPIAVDEARIAGEGLVARFAGVIIDDLIEGDYRLAADDITVFSGVAGRELGGAVTLAATGNIGVRLDRFDLAIDGAADDLAVGIEAVDALFSGLTTLSGGVARGEEGVRFDDLVLDHANARAVVTGVYGAEGVDVVVEAALPDLAVMTNRASGAVRLDAALTGVADAPAVEAAVSGEALMLTGRPFADATARFVGTLAGRELAGDFSLTGLLDGVAIELSTDVSTVDGLYELEEIVLSAGATQATGALTVRPDGLVAGAVRFESPDLSAIGPLLLTEMTGAISADIRLSVVDEGQSGHIVATARNVRAGAFSVGSADIDVTGENLLRAPILAGEVDASAIVVGPLEITALSATAERVGDRTEFAATAELTEGVVTATGRLVPENGGLDIEFDTFELRDAALDATLAEPVVIAIRNGTLAIPSARLAVGGGSVVVAGEIGETLNLQAQVSTLNLAVANVFAPGLGLTGTVSGTLAATGPADAPRGSFQFQGSGLSTAQLREAGVGAFAFEAAGQIVAGAATLEAALSGGGISLSVAGAVPLTGAGLDLAISGSLPLSLADMVLAERGASLSGTLLVDARISGALADPSFSGTVAADGATFADADSGIQLTAITLRAGFSADRVVVETLTARAAGGTLSATGTVGIGAGFPADLGVTLADFRYQDGRLLTAIVDGQLTVTGPLVGAPVLGGTITIERAEIAVPEQIPQGAAMLDVVHRAPPPAVAETLRLARLDEPRLRERRGGLVLDVTIDAPARIFVRGRGIDAEFGGSMTLTGPVSDIRPIGSFEMRRGHITILGQRINFNFGTVTLVGDLDPVLSFVATTRARTVEITANVSGRASDPDIALSSVPELPQDEVLAQFLFGRSLRDLSPFQIAQLASAAAGLAGGADATGLLGQLRGATGLDELDLVVGEEGGVAVQAGRYVVENVYLGVRAGQEGEAGVTVNLDITDDITARGEVGTDGRSKIGVFFEREY